MSSQELSRSINLPTAIFFIIGYVVGASIFILPGSLSAEVGPAVFLAYLLAAVPAVIAGVVMAQIGSALPVSGAIYVLLKQALSPFAGFLYIWIMISMGAVVLPMLAIGFADYFTYFVPDVNITLLASVVVILFVILNCFGVGVAAMAQNILVVIFLIALVLFSFGALVAGDASLLQPLFPKGFSPLAMAAITAFFSYAGVFVIVEIAGEVKNPGRNIPRAILYSFMVIILLYALVPLALNMLIPWQDLAQNNRAVVSAAQMFLPAPLVTFIAISALFAAATSVNGIMLGLSRDLFQGASAGLFPAIFAKVHPRTQVPVGAVFLVGTFALIGTYIGGAVTSFAQLALIGLMIIQVMTGIALIRLPRLLPKAYEQARFKLSHGQLVLVGVLYIVFSLVFLVLLSSEKPMLLMIGLAYLAVGIIYQQIYMRIK